MSDIISTPIDEFFAEEVAQVEELKGLETEVSDLREELRELNVRNSILESIIDEDEQLWKALSDLRHTYDLPYDKQQEQMQRAWSAYCTNPLAHRQVDHVTAYVSGEDLQFTSSVAEVEEWVNDFWFSAQNQMPIRCRKFSNEFQLNGNLFTRFWVSTATGKVVARSIPPHEIKDIIHDPDDVETVIYVKREFVRHKYSGSTYITEPITEFIPSLDTIRNPELLNKVEVPEQQVNIGIQDKFESYMHQSQIPTVSGRKWGMTTLSPHLYWLREYKTMLRHIVNLNKARSAYVMDVTITGSADDVEKERKKHRVPPSPGTVLIHTDKVAYDYKNPNTGSANTAADLRALKLMIVAGSGFPEHIVTGDASNANFASTKSTNYPFYRKMKGYQELWKYTYHYGIMWVVLWAAHTYGPLKKEYEVELWDDRLGAKVRKVKKIYECLDMTFPELDQEDPDRLASAYRIYSEVGLVSRRTMSIKAGFKWSNEKPQMDREQEEQMEKFKDQSEQQAGVQSMMGQDQVAQQVAGEQMTGEQEIGQAVMAKQAGVPEASRALQKMVAAQSGAMGMQQPPGQGGLMQSKRFKIRYGSILTEDGTIIPTRAIPGQDKLRESNLAKKRVRRILDQQILVKQILEEDEEY